MFYYLRLGQGLKLMMQSELILLGMILIGLFGRSSMIAAAASILLILKLTSSHQMLYHLERKSLDIGLLLLMMAVLVPFASEKMRWNELKPLLTTKYGLIALTSGAAATYLNGRGLDLLQMDPETIVGLVVGSIFGILFLKGVPVGPLMAAGITVVLLHLFRLILNM